MRYLTLVFCLLAYFAVYLDAKLPPYFKPCHRNAKNYDECLEQSIMYMTEKLYDSNVTKNLPSIDPLYLPDTTEELHFLELGANILSHETCVRKLSKFVITSIKADNNSFMVRIKFPRVEVGSKIKVSVMIDKYNFTEVKGILNVTLENMGASCLLKGNIVQVNKHPSMSFNSLKVDLAVVDYKARAKLDNFKFVEPIFNKMLLKNKKWFMDLCQRTMAKTAEETMLKRIKELSKGYAYSELFPK